MEKTQVLIIGGSAAGLVAGITARRHYRETKITLVRREKRGQVMVPCGIPYIFGTLGTPEKNIIPEELISNNKFDLIVDEITSIDRKSKTVITSKGKSLGYEKLVLATGSMPLVPPVPGADLRNVFCPDTREIKVKLIFERASGEILGAQLCGGVIVGEATNILAAFIQRKAKADEIATFQCGTHPLLTPSPLAYPIVNAAENGLAKL